MVQYYKFFIFMNYSWVCLKHDILNGFRNECKHNTNCKRFGFSWLYFKVKYSYGGLGADLVLLTLVLGLIKDLNHLSETCTCCDGAVKMLSVFNKYFFCNYNIIWTGLAP